MAANDGDINGEDLASGNGVFNEEGKEDMDTYKKIRELTDDDIRGLEFDSEEKATQFYEIYADCHGFVVRKDDVNKDDDGNIIARRLVCNREGENKNKKQSTYSRQTIRTKCSARLRVVLNVDTNKWRVSGFEPSHNHELTPTRSAHLVPKNRQLSESDKALVDGLHAHGVRTCHILGFMMAQKGGHESLGFCRKDLYNYLYNEGKARIEGGDSFAALSYLQAKADNDPMFFSKFTTTEEGRLENLFWSDSTSRIDYECFGDVVAFDATYRKNRYDKPLVIFSGCNHHGGTIIFGCALVSNETRETYKWLLNTFLEAMYHKQPKGVVTDGDLSMREAIKEVFPNSLHRLCSWHFHRNAEENVKNPKFLEEFSSLIYANYTVDKFEIEWKRVIDDYNLSDNTWVKKAYEMKTMWASAYMRENFFCGIRTTSRCEGINSFINMYVESKNSLIDFMHGFNRAVKEYRHKELMADFNTFYYKPVLTTKLHRFELEASKIFTRIKFYEVQNEIEDAITLNVFEQSSLGKTVKFKMNRFGNKDSTYLVQLDKEQSKFLCDCRQFERIGIPCSHIICAMRHEHITEFPDSLICKRWTKSAKDDYISSMSSKECDDEKMFMFRRGTMSTALNNLYDISCKHPDDYKEAMEGIYSLCEKIKRRRESGEKYKTNPSVIGDPIKAKAKGAPRKKKKSSRKRRHCSLCKNIAHTKQNCPELAGRDVLNEVNEEDYSRRSDHDKNVGCEGVDKSCDRKRKRKVVNVTSMQEDINKRRSKQIENEGIGRPNENMTDKNMHTGFDNSQDQGDVHDKPPVKMEDQNVTWKDGSMYVPNYFTGANGVPIQSVPIFPQFPNQIASTFPQFFPNQGASIFPQFPRADNFPSHSSSVGYGRAHNVPHHTPFMGALEMERLAKMDKNTCGNEDSKLSNHKQWDKHPK